MKITKHFILFFLVYLFTSGLFFAGGNQQSAQQIDQQPSIQYWLVKPSSVEPSNDLPLVRAIQDRTGINFQFETVPGEGHVERFNVTMASRNIPDVMYYFRFSEISKYAQQGAFAPLQDLIAEHAPNIQALHNEFPNMVRDIRFSDGNIYTIHGIPNSRVQMGFMLRGDWLEKLGLAIPETIDEWEIVLRAFKNQDPNGNGLADEIPFSSRQDGVSSQGGRKGFFSMVQAWGIQDDFFIEDGVIKYGPADLRMREALEVFRRWYSEGLIDNDYLTTNRNQWETKFASDLAGATHDWTSRVDSLIVPTKNITPEAHLVPVPPPVLRPGQQPVTMIQNPAFRMDNIITISADAPNKVEIIKFLDFLFSPEGSLISYAGPPGGAWDYVNGIPTFTDDFINHPELTPAQHVQVLGAQIFPEDARTALQSQLEDPSLGSYQMRQMYAPFIIDAFPNLKFTNEEQSILARRLTEIRTYKDEMIDKMIMGITSIDEFDQYVTTLNEMGLQEVLRIYNDAYARY